LVWISDGPPEPSAWAELRAEHARTGLWPLLLGALSSEEPGRPWTSGELHPDLVATEAGDHEPESVLARWWADSAGPDPACPDEGPAALIAPYGAEWPGLAAPGVGESDPDEVADQVALFELASCALIGPRLGLAAAVRSADALATVAWTGPVNHENDTALFSAVLRSWEDRFGVRVISLGFATLTLSVAAPPTDLPHALNIAAEHVAFCPDNVFQGTGFLREYAETLIGQEVWSFWWD
jgi:hypothetical protein